MALAWDAGSEAVVIEAQTPTEDGDYLELPDDAEDGPDLLRVRIDATDARGFVREPRRSWPPAARACPFCGQPLDPRVTSARAATGSSTERGSPPGDERGSTRPSASTGSIAGEFGDGRPGRLGLTFIPGKHGASMRYPGRVYRRDLERDLGRSPRARRASPWSCSSRIMSWRAGATPTIVDRGREPASTIERRPMPDGKPPPASPRWTRWSRRIDGAREIGRRGRRLHGWRGSNRHGRRLRPRVAGGAPRRRDRRVRAVRHPTAVETPDRWRSSEAYERHIAERGRSSARLRRERAMGLQTLLRGQRRDGRSLPRGAD